ncbi:MAG: class I SAM-dependent methyltransferase [Candidatus Omnitrophica bacterium]|jgi:ubiquinone/menaquinone biosynthesis C-methylase UbiE|nr:class I SAM-dependent methyltransferase [Candidatus Omnitrophota bacterium]
MKVNSKTTKSWFNCWSNKYDQTLGKISFHRDLLDLIASNSKVKDGDKILDVGCGTGLLSLRLLQKSDCAIIGVDYSKEMLDIFKDKIKKLKLHNKVSVGLIDANSLNFKKNTFDIVVSSVALHHLRDKLQVVRTIFRILKPGGIFIIGEIDMDSTGKHTDPQRLKRIVKALEQEWIPALQDAGVKAFSQMYDNGKKHIFNQGEYCLSFKQWADICKKAGFGPVSIRRVSRHKVFGVILAKKPVN